MRHRIGCLAALLLSGCLADASQNVARTTSGTVIGSSQQRDIELRDSRIDLGVSDLTVQSRRGRSLNDRYDELVNFGSGYVRYQRLENLQAFSESLTSSSAIQSIVNGAWFRDRGLTGAVRDIKTVVNQYGRAQYAIVENAQWRCAVFAQYFWGGAASWMGPAGDSEVRGANCYQPADARAANLEADTTRLLQRLRLGPNVNAHAAVAPAPSNAVIPAAATAPATAAATPPVVVPAAEAMAARVQQGNNWAARPGTRFVTYGGYLQIVRVEGDSVVTVNAANQTGRWIYGLISPRDNATLDTVPLATLFPLAVGKEVSLEERSGNDRWNYAVRVTGTEQIAVKNKTYDTFVVEVRDRSLTPDQGGFDRTRTFWYSPEAGGHLRMRSKQSGGPPVRLFDWDVTEVVPPR